MAEFPAPKEGIVLTYFIVSDDVERSRRFYTEVLGLRFVKRTVNFSPYSTDRIRINVTNALSTWSRITEVEAWGN